MVKKVAPPFAFQRVPSHDAVGVDVSKDDILQNFLGRDDVAMNGGVPWRDHVRRPMPSCRCLWRLYLHLEMSSWIAQHQ